MQRLCDAKDKLLEAREAEKQQLGEMLEQRLRELGISPERLYYSGTAEKQEVVCRTSYLAIVGNHKCVSFNISEMLVQHGVVKLAMCNRM